MTTRTAKKTVEKPHRCVCVCVCVSVDAYVWLINIYTTNITYTRTGDTPHRPISNDITTRYCNVNEKGMTGRREPDS